MNQNEIQVRMEENFGKPYMLGKKMMWKRILIFETDADVDDFDKTVAAEKAAAAMVAASASAASTEA